MWGTASLARPSRAPPPPPPTLPHRHPTPSHPHQDSVCSISSVCRGLGEGSLPARNHYRLTIGVP